MTRATTLWDRSAACGRGVLNFLRDKSGNVLVMTALTAPILLGMAALGFDVISWYMMKRNAQTIVDNAALAATLELQRGSEPADVKSAAAAHAAHSGFVDGTHGKLTVNVPPLAGPHAGDDMFVEVVVEQSGTYLLSAAMFKDDATTITSRAVGGLYSGGNYCVLALHTSVADAIRFSGSSTAELNYCSVASNSSHSQAMFLDGDSLTADIAQAVGGITYNPTDVTLTYNPPREGAPQVADPYDDLVVVPDPSTMTCDYSGLKVDDTRTMDPGVYCGKTDFNSKADITLNPGVYVIYDGRLRINASAQITGTDVTFLFTGPASDAIGQLDINGGAIIDLTAPDDAGHNYGPYSGEYGGVLFFQDPTMMTTDNDWGGTARFNGGAQMAMEGATYFPQSDIEFSGGIDVEVGCLQVIGRTVTFTGNSHVTATREDCGALGTKTVGTDIPSLFE